MGAAERHSNTKGVPKPKRLTCSKESKRELFLGGKRLHRLEEQIRTKKVLKELLASGNLIFSRFFIFLGVEQVNSKTTYAAREEHGDIIDGILALTILAILGEELAERFAHRLVNHTAYGGILDLDYYAEKRFVSHEKVNRFARDERQESRRIAEEQLARFFVDIRVFELRTKEVEKVGHKIELVHIVLVESHTVDRRFFANIANGDLAEILAFHKRNYRFAKGSLGFRNSDVFFLCHFYTS
jgi:hypothetical protein